MMIKKASLCVAALLTVSSAFAGNSIGLYFTPSADLNQGASGTSDESRGDGFGVVGKFDLFGPTFIMGEYSAVTYDEQTTDGEFDLNQARLGFGVMIPLPATPLSLMSYLEVVDVDDDSGSSRTGGGAHVGLVFEPNTAFNVFAQVGYLDVDGIVGGEYKVGINANATSRFGLFTEYRGSDLENEDDNDAKVNFDDFHVGAKFNF